MKLWLQVILEWLNCLDILGTSIKDLKELEDEKFYRKLIELLSWKDANEISTTENIVTKFLQDEYPKFKFDGTPSEEMEHIYIASLFLLRTSQETLFHRPMCNKLQHETQIKIKTYLEMLIPYGKDINREALNRVIHELEDDAQRTPVTPRTQSLRDFFKSPATRSAQGYKLLSERSHELRKLKTELEVERFEKIDLQEDLRIQQNKMQNLQKKLQEKTAEIKALREEKMKPDTPQSCKKNKSTLDYEQQYRKEVDRLEDQLTQKQCEIDKLEMDNDALSKKLRCIEKQVIHLMEKLDNSEKSYENLQIQGETKDRELVNLRLTNEELRTHLKELSKAGIEDQSFEMDGIAPLNVTLSPLNSSEALSSVIEIQLQEAKEESALLKTQLDTVKQKLESKSQEYENVTQLLKEKTTVLENTETTLNTALDKLTKEIESLQEERTSLINKNKSLEDSYNSQRELLLQVEGSKNTLNAEVVTLRETIKNVEESLHNVNENNLKLDKAITEAKSQLQENIERIQDLTHQNNLYKTSIETSNASLKEVVLHNLGNSGSNNLNDATTLQLVEHLQTILHNLGKNCTSKEMELASLNAEVEEMKLKEQVTESKHKQIMHDLQTELVNTKEKLMECVQKLEKLEETKDALEKHHKNLKSQNTKILHDLNDINDKLKLSQQEISNMSNQLRFKDEKIGNLITEITSLKLEKEHVVHLQMEGESKMKNFISELETKLLEKQRCLDQLNIETKLKQETLDLVQNKFEKVSKEAIVSEMKMKEVIMNLQEVRITQDAVLTTQEKALKEKHLQIQQFQAEFSESKAALQKQLQEEKLLSQNLRSTNSELQIELHKRMKTIEELQEMLQNERRELDKSKEHFKAEETKKLELARVCEKLEQSVNRLKLTITEASPKNENFYADSTHGTLFTDNDEKTKNILNIIGNSMNEMHASRKLILHLFNTNVSLNATLQNQKEIVDNYGTKCEEIKSLEKDLQELKEEKENHIQCLNNFISCKESLRNSLQDIIKSREDLDVSLAELKQKWDRLLTKSRNIFTIEKSVCDELKHIQAKKTYFEDAFSKHNTYHLQNLKPVQTILWQKFLWTEEKLQNGYLSPTNNEQCSTTLSNTFANEKAVIEEELQKNILLKEDIIRSQNEVDEFSDLVASFEISSDETKYQSEVEKKLQLQINELVEEKNDLGSKLECARLRNGKLESHINELTNKVKELEAASSIGEENLKKIIQLKEENLILQRERDELNKRPTKEDVDNELKNIHNKYKIKLDEVKQNMKTAYNEQITKLNREQEQCIQKELESLQRKMELQCRKQADELSKYKAHVADMSSQIWNVGEKLLSEQQEKEKLQKELIELKIKYHNLDQQIHSSIERRCSKYERSDLLSGENKEEVLRKVAVIQEKTTYERCSIKSIQRMGNAFDAEDEEGEVFNNTYLADMKNGHTSFSIDPDRVSILQKRNALCKPHLKSSYPAEMQFHPLPFTEEEIKSGAASDEIFNDSLSQSLLPEQKVKKKDRTQTSYKKYDPPTPSKNGGRASLQGNELRSPNSRILRERNKDRTTATPRTLKSLFSSRRQDENVIVTPRGRRRSSIFRKYRTNDR